MSKDELIRFIEDAGADQAIGQGLSGGLPGGIHGLAAQLGYSVTETETRAFADVLTPIVKLSGMENLSAEELTAAAGGGWDAALRFALMARAGKLADWIADNPTRSTFAQRSAKALSLALSQFRAGPLA